MSMGPPLPSSEDVRSTTSSPKLLSASACFGWKSSAGVESGIVLVLAAEEISK